MHEIATYCFIVLAGIATLLLLFTKNVMHAAYLLMITLVSIAAIFILFGAEFIGVSQLMVYVGGILILLIFGIMLTNRITGQHIISETHHTFIGITLGASLFVALYLACLNQGFLLKKNSLDNITEVSDIGTELMTSYVLEFEIVGILLLLVLIGAAFIAKRKTQVDGHS